MKKTIILILIPLLSFIFTADKQPILKPNNKGSKINEPSDSKMVEAWHHDESDIKNDEYRKEIEGLKNEFDNKKQNIINTYNKQIVSIRKERENSINNLRDSFAQRRKEIRKKYDIRDKGDRPVKKVKDKKINKKLPKEKVAQPEPNKQPINKKPINQKETKENGDGTPIRKKPTN